MWPDHVPHPAPPSLPPLPVWQARSFWASLLLVATVAANAFGVDLAAHLGDPDTLLDRGAAMAQALAPVAFGLWAWLERRAPNYRLVWGRP